MLDTSKHGQLCCRKAYSKADLLAIAQRLYNNLLLQFQILSQQSSVLAIIRPQPAKQIILILRTSSGKTLPVIVGTAVSDASTTILILLMVAL
jgi:hypothetical protein